MNIDYKNTWIHEFTENWIQTTTNKQINKTNTPCDIPMFAIAGRLKIFPASATWVSCKSLVGHHTNKHTYKQTYSTHGYYHVLLISCIYNSVYHRSIRQRLFEQTRLRYLIEKGFHSHDVQTKAQLSTQHKQFHQKQLSRATVTIQTNIIPCSNQNTY